MALPIGALVAMGVGSAAGSVLGSERAASQSVGFQKYALDYQRDVSSSAHQRQMADMRLAGLNPILSAKLGGASGVSAGSPSIPDYGQSINRGIQAAMAGAEVQQKGARIDNLGANTAKQIQETKTEIERGLKLQAETAESQSRTAYNRAMTGLAEHRQQLTRAQTVLQELGVSEAKATALVFENEGEILKMIERFGGFTAQVLRFIYQLARPSRGRQ